MRERTIWISAGLLGLAVAIALAVLTSHVSQPPVGVPGEPVSAGKQLAPARTGAARDGAAAAAPGRPVARTTTTAATPPPPAGSEPRDDDESDSSGSGSDDESGRGRGRGRGRGGDD